MDLIFWVAFLLFIGYFLALDLGVFHKSAHIVLPREALAWTTVWVSLAILFGIGVFLWRGSEVGIQWFTGYVIEYSLSVDNVFVFALVFAAFAVPRELQHRVLFWGVVGALVMRFGLILVGASLIESYHWIIYIFGAFLVFTGLRMLRVSSEHTAHPENNPLVRFAMRHMRVVSEFHGQKFFIPTAAGRAATPLFLALIAVETTDLIFAVDSIPAIFAITTDPFIVFTSNAFALLGLRSLYFLLADAADRFRYLKVGLALVLIFVGGKMLLSEVFKIDPVPSLAVIVAIIGGSVVASLWANRRDAKMASNAVDHS
ncbi:MAG: TerC family protein [Chloroflexi bacterium]|nr:TerC family protein [Chloroflexota bacterium]